MDPRYRFALVLSFGLVGWWLLTVISTYLVGEQGLNWERYAYGVTVLGGSALAGWLLVWVSSKALAWRKTLQTGFEPSFTDEFGTEFAMTGLEGVPVPFKLALSKFNPVMVAPPNWLGLTPLEAELIGFLQGYRTWPANLQEDLFAPKTTLYEQALARWQVVRGLPGSTALARVLALSSDLAMVHALEDVRTSAPWWRPWVRDRVHHRVRTVPHGGMAALVLSTMPEFRALGRSPEGAEQQRALLTALRFAATPALLPLNAPDESRTLMDLLQRAEAQVALLDIRELDTLTPDLLQDLQDTLEQHWARVVLPLVDNTEVWRLHNPAALAAPLPALLVALAPCLSPGLRHVLHLWDLATMPTDERILQHPAWGHISTHLQDWGWLANSWQDMPANNGTFLLTANTPEGAASDLTPRVIVLTDMLILAPLRKQLLTKPIVEVVTRASPEQLRQQALHKAGLLDAELGQLF